MRVAPLVITVLAVALAVSASPVLIDDHADTLDASKSNVVNAGDQATHRFIVHKRQFVAPVVPDVNASPAAADASPSVVAAVPTDPAVVANPPVAPAVQPTAPAAVIAPGVIVASTTAPAVASSSPAATTIAQSSAVPIATAPAPASPAVASPASTASKASASASPRASGTASSSTPSPAADATARWTWPAAVAYASNPYGTSGFYVFNPVLRSAQTGNTGTGGNTTSGGKGRFRKSVAMGVGVVGVALTWVLSEGVAVL